MKASQWHNLDTAEDWLVKMSQQAEDYPATSRERWLVGVIGGNQIKL